MKYLLAEAPRCRKLRSCKTYPSIKVLYHFRLRLVLYQFILRPYGTMLTVIGIKHTISSRMCQMKQLPGFMHTCTAKKAIYGTQIIGIIKQEGRNPEFLWMTNGKRL